MKMPETRALSPATFSAVTRTDPYTTNTAYFEGKYALSVRDASTTPLTGSEIFVMPTDGVTVYIHS
jgi:hypothetical protein